MAVNLFNVLDSEFSDDVVAKIGSYLNEQPAKAKVGLANAVPAILCALHQKTATTAGQNDLFGMLQRGGGTIAIASTDDSHVGLEGDNKNFNLDKVIEGDLEGLVEALTIADHAARLQSETGE